MAKTATRPYSRYSGEAIRLLAGQIRAARLERGVTAQDLSERAGISRGLLRRIENGDPGCGIGVVFEVATLLGVTLFRPSHSDLRLMNKMLDEKLTLLPSRIRPRAAALDDDF
ncbi:MAG: helix-turn-helix transcriptional regulator [Parvularculales bacterium]